MSIWIWIIIALIVIIGIIFWMKSKKGGEEVSEFKEPEINKDLPEEPVQEANPETRPAEPAEQKPAEDNSESFSNSDEENRQM